MNNLHWVIWAGDEIRKPKTGGEVIDWAVDIQIRHIDSEEEAVKRAKEIITRKYYKLRSVIECDCAKHNIQQLKQLEATREYAKILKKQFPDNDEEENG